AVIIDEAKIAIGNQDVAVLQISVSDPVLPQNTEHLDPTFGKVGKRDGILDVRLDHVLKGRTFDPFHLQDGIPMPANAYSLFEKLKTDCIRNSRGGQMASDFGIAF